MSDHLSDHVKSTTNQTINNVRSQQIGSGMRGDKIRTFRFQDNIAVDHRTGNKVPLDKVMNGQIELL